MAVLKKNKVVYFSEYYIVLNRKILIDMEKFHLFMEIIKNITEKSFIVTDYEYSHAGLIDPKMTFYIWK